ncbi:pimeloyl-ACP methyl ester carboxylesterase [Catenuloplanes nepalensis]|uniref:Pimeloyl-ACP methyl ester carboxylesterase n=1 Tax=Catenuloplanes nepalensis TaxID=587533 RepID=A0ABT9MMT3_9ACTN|nr:pimeloyl-ACP methyl ester carboxylesterase [Catenuloplanes nepalensis]
MQSALAAGHAVLYIDRIGVGGSDRPPAEIVNADTEAHVAHQLVQRLRKDRYRTVVAVGHSYGSLIWAAESHRYDDVDALVLSGYLHGTHVPTQLLIRAHLQQAEGAPPGYLTQAPNFRRQAYLHPPGVTRQMTELDERIRTTGTSGELTSLKNMGDPTYTSRIRRPVLLQIGVHDLLFCNALTGLPCASPADLCTRETAFYPRTRLSATVQRDTGHSILIHRSAQSATATALSWIDHTVGRAPHPRAVLDCR